MVDPRPISFISTDNPPYFSREGEQREKTTELEIGSSIIDLLDHRPKIDHVNETIITTPK